MGTFTYFPRGMSQYDSQIPGPVAAFGPRARDNARATLRLGLPSMASRAGILVMISVDALMVGHTGQDQLAHLGLAFAIQGVLMLISVGFLQGVMILISQAYGAREYDFCAEIWHIGLILAALMGGPALAISLLGEEIYLLLGQDPSIAAGGGAALAQFGWGMPAMMGYIACSYFLEGIQRPRIAMVVMAGAILLNIAFNAVALYAMDTGAPGAAAATSLVRWIILAAMLLYITRIMHDRAEFGVRMPGRATRESLLRVWRFLKRTARLGLPMALLQGAESLAFLTLSVTAGILGEAELAAHTVTFQVIQLTFMLAIGMSAATAVRVGYAVGANDQPAIRWAGWTGVVLILILILPILLFFFVVPVLAGSIFTSAPATLAIAETTIRIAALLLIFDCLWAVLQGALRGAGDVWVPLIIHAGAMWLITVPLAQVLAIGLGWGVAGLFVAMALGLATVSMIGLVRFQVISGRVIKRV